MKFVASEAVAAVKHNLNIVLERTPTLKMIVEELYSNIYIIGGFIRDSYFGKRARDIDMMVDVDEIRLKDVVDKSGCLYAINRHGGMKLYIDSIVVDIWTIDNNWAFKSNSVQL